MFAAQCTMDDTNSLLTPEFSPEPGDFWLPIRTSINELPESSAEPLWADLGVPDDVPVHPDDEVAGKQDCGRGWLMELLARQSPEELGYIRDSEGDWWAVGSKVAALAGRLERNEPVTAEEIASVRRLVEGAVTGWTLEPPAFRATLDEPESF